MPPVKVFGTAISTAVARVLVCLEEVGAEYELVSVDFLAGDPKSPAHLVRNPFGLVPAFQDGDLLLFESRAIARYVLNKYISSEIDLLRKSNPKEAALVDVWTEVEAHQYYPAISPIVYECLVLPGLYGTTTNQNVVDECLGKLKSVVEIYEAHLSKNKYLAGDNISFADLSHFPFTFYFMATPYAYVFYSYPCVNAWWEGLMSRPSFRKVAANMPTKF